MKSVFSPQILFFFTFYDLCFHKSQSGLAHINMFPIDITLALFAKQQRVVQKPPGVIWPYKLKYLTVKGLTLLEG